MTKILFVLASAAVTAAASVENPAHILPAINRAPDVESGDALTGYTDHSAWLAEAGTTVTIDFDSITSGTVITTQLDPYGISNVSGKSGGGVSVDQIVLSSAELPFPMFTAGDLPSEPNFISNDMSSPYYATGEITFELNHKSRAIGAYVADGSPLGDFCIEVFDGSTSLGLITVDPRTLPNDAFVGLISEVDFDSARFYAASTTDSWGLDNLELNDSTDLYSRTWGAIKAVCF
jgi:hypothetical protein